MLQAVVFVLRLLSGVLISLFLGLQVQVALADVKGELFQPTPEWEKEAAIELDMICADTWCEGDFWFTDFKVQCQNDYAKKRSSCNISFNTEWPLDSFERSETLKPFISVEDNEVTSGDAIKDPYYFLKFRNSCQIDDLPLVKDAEDAALSARNFAYDSLEVPLGACIEKQERVASEAAFTLTDKKRSCTEGGLCSSSIDVEGVRKNCVPDQGCQYFFQWFLEVGRVEGSVEAESLVKYVKYSGQTDFTWGSSCYVPVGAAPGQERLRLEDCLRQQKYNFLKDLQVIYKPKQKFSVDKALQCFDRLVV